MATADADGPLPSRVSALPTNCPPFVGSALARDQNSFNFAFSPTPRPQGYSSLRRYRYSAPGFTCFLTICTSERAKILTRHEIGAAVADEIERMASDGVWRVHAFTFMPDHIHLLVGLGVRLSLTQAVARLKAKTKNVLLGGNAKWQVNYFDHRMRPDESLLPVLLYIYLNPYRKNLVNVTGRWPWFYCHEEEWRWFKDHLIDELPEPEWLR